jgi:hypothetical protein
VTQDESQVSVGGMLALEQVLRKHWLCLTTFGTLIGWSKMEFRGRDEITESHIFCRLVDPAKGFRVYVAGYGMLSPGFTHV